MSKPIKHTSFAIRCCLCNKQFTTIQSFSNHLGLAHKIDKNHKKDYYDKYMKQENEGTCLKCGKPTHFQSLNKGYTRYCCRSCQVSAQGNGAKIDHNKMWKIRRNKINEYEIQHNCINLKRIDSLFGRYGYEAINKLNIPIIKVSKMYQYIDNKYLDSIKNFVDNYERASGISGIEKQFKSKIICNHEIMLNSKKIIYPYELDMYIPELKLAIEFNGLYYHSLLHNSNKNYHLEKSLMCREKGIRLIHVYEFEDLNEQIYKINQLILGNDLFDIRDFNKNNLTTNIPNSKIIYKEGRYIIYGAGKLY